MKLDPRIKSLSDILTCYDIEQANIFLGKKGYFAPALSDFNYLDIRKYGTLTDVRNNDYPFREGNDEYWSLFIPESRLIKKENKFRPFTIEEFRQEFTIGQPIRYRHKENNVFENETLFMGFEKLHEEDYHGDIKTLVLIGHSGYDLDELFKYCEYKDVLGNWIPFGVEE